MATTVVVRDSTKVIKTSATKILLHRDGVTPPPVEEIVSIPGGGRRGPYQVSKSITRFDDDEILIIL